MKKLLYLLVGVLLLGTICATKISEVYYDPYTPEIDNEFVEIFFDGINPQGWTITTFDGDYFVIPAIINYNQYSLLFTNQVLE